MSKARGSRSVVSVEFDTASPSKILSSCSAISENIINVVVSVKKHTPLIDMKPVKNDLKCLCSVDKPIETSQNLIGDQDPIPKENIGDSILNALKSKPNFIGQVNAETKEQITFQQMRENSVKCALWLKKVGVKKGDVVTICTRNPSVVYMPFLASIYIGAIVNPWEEKYFRDMIRVMYFLVINEPDVIFVDRDNFTQLLLSIVILKSIKKVIKIVTIGKINISIRLNSLETILNDDFDKTEIDQFSCEKNHMMDTAIRTFSSVAKTYPGQVDVPYIAFSSPSNKQTPVMIPGAIGLWYGSLCWTHGPLLTVHAILSRVTAIKSAVLSEVNLYKTIKKYKVNQKLA
ncbi:uncharacterized protein LOC112454639 [Temnothorax curvispinosus]|uniref:Uncharacterized protein LOC112454639 n=1 Tax=Temnothorax curvispinosus TaxID=300111 RepID=A0A6J1PRK5_9HYME|nr:uncharacterized protein LOC112454639 [Temnothorax curvispinosus]